MFLFLFLEFFANRNFHHYLSSSFQTLKRSESIISSSTSLQIVAKTRKSVRMKTCQHLEKKKSILYVMGKFSISWEAYRELTQLERTLPRSYLVEGQEAT